MIGAVVVPFIAEGARDAEGDVAVAVSRGIGSARPGSSGATKEELERIVRRLVALDERQSSQPSYPVTSGVADNSARRPNGDHPPDRQMAKGRQGCGGYQNRFARQRNAEALDGNEEEYDCIAV